MTDNLVNWNLKRGGCIDFSIRGISWGLEEDKFTFQFYIDEFGHCKERVSGNGVTIIGAFDDFREIHKKHNAAPEEVIQNDLTGSEILAFENVALWLTRPITHGVARSHVKVSMVSEGYKWVFRVNGHKGDVEFSATDVDILVGCRQALKLADEAIAVAIKLFGQEENVGKYCQKVAKNSKLKSGRKVIPKWWPFEWWPF